MSSDSEAPLTLEVPKDDSTIRNQKLTSIIQKAVSLEWWTFQQGVSLRAEDFRSVE